MLNQLFGLKNVKTSAELKSVGKRTKALAVSEDDCCIEVNYLDNDIWNTGATDALRVPILANAHYKHSISNNASLPIFGLGVNNNKYQLSEENPYGVSTELTFQKEKPTLTSLLPSSNDLSITVLGVYSKSIEYGRHIQTILGRYDLNIHVFGPSDRDALLEIGINISAWVIDLSDEEDCAVLALLLDEYGDVPSLFLSETSPSSKCISKLMSFIQNNELELIA